MMNKISDIFVSKKDLGKKVYRKVSTYTIEIAQDVLADSEEQAEQLFLDGGGIDHSKITTDLAEAKDGVETTIVDANYTDSGDTTYLGKVAYDEDDEYAEEDGNVVIDTYADEVVNEKALNDYVKEKAESDIDTAIQLEAEAQLGK